MRFQHRYLARLDKMAISFGWIILSDGAGRAPGVWKSFDVSDDGQVYTFQLREGARWSDGFPLTMEDIRFSNEDFMLNKEAMPGLPGDLKSPLTGNDYVFEIVDDTTFKMSFDSPHFTFIESKSNPGLLGDVRLSPLFVLPRPCVEAVPSEVQLRRDRCSANAV